MSKQQQTKVKGCKKAGRTKRKRDARMKPLSRYIRNKITFEQYYKLTFKGSN